MNSKTKIHLSKLELQLIQNKEWILTKQSIITKVYQLFGDLHENCKCIFENEKGVAKKFVEKVSGKISKGENYLQLPYVILDYPAIFSRENIFAIRSMFWWGNFFSVSLHLSGNFFLFNNNFSTLKSYLQKNSFYVCVSENEWQHTFEPFNYILVAELTDDQWTEIIEKKFFKISKKINVNEWDAVAEFLKNTFIEIVEFLKINFPNDEIIL